MSGCRMPHRKAGLCLAMKFFRSFPPRGVPAIRTAVFDAGYGGEHLPDVHHALRGIADHRSGNKVEAGVGEESTSDYGIGGCRLGCRSAHQNYLVGLDSSSAAAIPVG